MYVLVHAATKLVGSYIPPKTYGNRAFLTGDISVHLGPRFYQRTGLPQGLFTVTSNVTDQSKGEGCFAGCHTILGVAVHPGNFEGNYINPFSSLSPLMTSFSQLAEQSW